MNKLSRFTTTTFTTPSAWTESPIGSTPVGASSTANTSTHVVMIQGKYVTDPRGQSELSVSIDPASIERKLAVMKMSAELDGQIITSTSTAL